MANNGSAVYRALYSFAKIYSIQVGRFWWIVIVSGKCNGKLVISLLSSRQHRYKYRSYLLLECFHATNNTAVVVLDVDILAQCNTFQSVVSKLKR